MPELTEKHNNPANKDLNMRRSKGSPFKDPLQAFQTPLAIRKTSETLDSESANLEGRIQKISESSNEPIGDEWETTSKTAFLYIDQRQLLLEDLAAHCRKARNIARESWTALSRGSERDELKRALTRFDESSTIVLKERTALAAGRMRVQYSVLSHPGSVKIGKAYKLAITTNLPKPGHSSYNTRRERLRADQTSFRHRLIKASHAKGSKVLEIPDDVNVPSWCPTSGKEFPVGTMRAAHIVPHSIGETNAAYLFGFKQHEECGVIWSNENGLMMNADFARVFYDGRMVIVPDPTNENEFISIILCQDLKKDFSYAIDAPYSTIHRRRLQFQTAARPGKRYLYVHALLTLFHRRRQNVPGWENDREEVFNGQTWPAASEKWARKSMIEVLAFEIGDGWATEGAEEGLGEFPGALPREEEERMATLMNYGWETKAIYVEDDYDYDDEEDEDDDDDEELGEDDEDEDDDDDGELW